MQDSIHATSSTSTSTYLPRSNLSDTIPILLHRFKNLNHLLGAAMGSYALPESHKDVSVLPV